MIDEQNIKLLEREWAENREYYSIQEFAEIFPEAKETIRQNILETLKEMQDIYGKIESSIAHYQKDPTIKPIAEAVIKLNFEQLYKCETKLKRLDWNLKTLERKEEDKSIDIEAIKSKTDVRELAERYGVKFTKRNGKNWSAKCCFHKDDTPSMSVSERLWYCFGCGKSGDAITFVEEIEQCSFQEAIKKI